MDTAMIAIALPTIGKEINFHSLSIEWLINSYILTIAAFGLISGKLSDIYNPKNIIIFGLIILMLASLGCFSSLNYFELIIFRAIQGFASVLLVAPSIKLLSEIFNRKELSKVMGITSGLGALGLIIAPFLSGKIIDYLGWRYIFLVNIPLSIIALICLLKTQNKYTPKKVTIDALGFVYLSIFLFSFVLIIMEPHLYSWMPVVFYSVIFALFASLIFFIAREKNAEYPILEFKIFKNSKFVIANIISVLVQAQSMSAIFWIMYMQIFLHFNPDTTGYLIMPLYILIASCGFLSGFIIHRKKAFIPLLSASVIIFLGYFISLILLPLKNYLSLLPMIIGTGISLPIFLNALRFIAIESTNKDNVGLAIGVLGNVRQISGAISLAIWGSILSSYSTSKNITYTIDGKSEGFYYGFYSIISLSTLICFFILSLSLMLYIFNKEKS
tara:strand:- start:26237 stop:27565 length:1329 start_codon:yes stop_codon:yes gene_type:complete